MHLRLFDPLRPKSAKASLAVIGLVVSTLLMGLFGAGSYYLTEQRLFEQKREFWKQLEQHLGPPVAKALWVYDMAGLNAALRAELGGSVLGLAVVDDVGTVVAQQGLLLPLSGGTLPADAAILSMDIPKVGRQELGRIHAAWSDATMREALRTTLWIALAQLITVSLVLLAVVWLGLERFVFSRVKELQQALDQATSRDMAADIVPLAVTTEDEFGAITHSINVITERLGEELEAGRESEEEARAALSNLENAQEGLVRSEKMASLGRLVAGIAHELNTPIGNLVMVASTQQEIAKKMVQAVAAGTLTRSALTAHVSQIAQGADLMLISAGRAAELIQNFKQVAVDQTTDQLRDFDLAKQMGEVLSVITHVVAKTPIKLVQQLEPGIAMRSYPGPLGQVVTNLVMNAIKHGFNDVQPGTITVTCVRQNDWVCITVTDDGMGIAPDDVGKVFDPFFTTKLGQGGTGLGLHISHNMVYGPLGGRMGVHSELGAGATFTVRMPCKAPGAARVLADPQ